MSAILPKLKWGSRLSTFLQDWKMQLAHVMILIFISALITTAFQAAEKPDTF